VHQTLERKNPALATAPGEFPCRQAQERCWGTAQETNPSVLLRPANTRTRQLLREEYQCQHAFIGYGPADADPKTTGDITYPLMSSYSFAQSFTLAGYVISPFKGLVTRRVSKTWAVRPHSKLHEHAQSEK